jgi:hypothetical protein
MAAKDADLATDHADRSLYISDLIADGAPFEVALMEHTIEAELPFLYATDVLEGSAFEITGVVGDAPAVALLSIEMIPPILTMLVSTDEQFRALATYDDGSVREVTDDAVWGSTTPATATVVAGFVTAVALGTTTITATVDAIVGSVPLTVAAATGDVTPPIVGNVSPAGGTGIESTQVITFDITDESELAHVAVFASFADGTAEMIHDGDGFRGKYVGGANTRSAIAGGFSYSVLRIGGWLQAPTIEYLPIDSSGNLGVVS